MKKFELEAKLIGAQNQLQSLHTELDKERAELKALKDSIPHLIEEAQYEDWKSQNEKFMKRFFNEYIKESLSVEIETTCGGSFTINLQLNGKTFNSEYGTICMARNGLEE